MLTRKQMLQRHRYRPTSRQRMAIGADRSGRITTIVHEGRTETARYSHLRGQPHRRRRDSMYTSPNMRRPIALCRLTSTSDARCAGQARPPARSRSSRRWTIWHTASAWIRSNCGCATNPSAIKPTGLPFSTRRLTECLKQGAATFGWSRRNPTPRSMRDGDQLIGIGMAAAGYHTIAQQVATRSPASTPTAPPTCRRAHQRHGARHLHVDDSGRRRCARAADGPGPVRPRRQPTFPLRHRIRARGPWPASGRRCSPSRTCCATGSSAPPSSTPPHP